MGKWIVNYRLLLTWMTVQPKLCGCQGCADDALVHLHPRTSCTVPAGCSSSSRGPGVSLGHCVVEVQFLSFPVNIWSCLLSLTSIQILQMSLSILESSWLCRRRSTLMNNTMCSGAAEMVSRWGEFQWGRQKQSRWGLGRVGCLQMGQPLPNAGIAHCPWRAGRGF